MPNRIIHELNSTLQESEQLADFYAKGYMLKYDTGLLRIPREQIVLCHEIDMYYRLTGYELFGSTEENALKLSAVASNMVGSLGAANTPFCFSLYNRNRKTKVYFGTSHMFAEQQIRCSVQNNIQKAALSNEWIPPEELSAIQKYNGMLIGTSEVNAGEIDVLLNGLASENFLYSCIFLPISRREAREEIGTINSFRDKLQRVATREMALGSNRQRHFNSDNHDILQRIKVLDKEHERIENGQASGLWYVAVFISSDNKTGYLRAASMFNAFFNNKKSGENTSLLTQTYSVDFSPISRNQWKIPVVFLGRGNYGGIYEKSLLNICNLSCAASLAVVPLFSHGGYSVKHLGDSAATAGAFDRFPTEANDTGERFRFGITESGNEYAISLDALRQHAFITGSTQYGKSTSVRKILSEASKAGIPFIVVESAKKEYWEMKKTPEMSGILVLSAGSDTRPLRINPFQPEEDTILDAHIQSLIQAFLSLFDKADPLPQILTNLIYMCYEKKGWDISRRVSSDIDLDYPILSDLLLNLNECIESIGYGEDVQNNMKGVIRVRIEALIRQAGKSLNTRENMSISRLFYHSAVIELDDYSDTNKPFVSSLLAIKANEFSKQSVRGGKLKRLLVLEEAHHIIPNPELKSVTENAALCSRYFSNMLAEVSAYGTGVVIVDQRLSAVSGNAIANTGFKLIHNLHEETDVEAAAASLALRPHEQAILPKLRIGEALVALPQTNEVSRIKVNGSLKKTEAFNLGSLFSDGSAESRCDLIGRYDINFLQREGFSASAVIKTIQNIQERKFLNFTRDEKLFLAGNLIRCSNYNEMRQRRRLYDVYEKLDD